MDEALRELARLAGIANDWVDANGMRQRVAIGSLRTILAALGFPCATAADLNASRARLTNDVSHTLPPLVTATVGDPIRLTGDADRQRASEIAYEDGGRADVTLQAADGGFLVPSVDRPGYHRLRIGDRELTLAVAPRRCVTVNDIAPDRRPWGLAVQLYGLRRDGDGGIGDTTALRALAKNARQYGADAIALSPTHSLFPADLTRYGPYSPSSRLFLNPLYADPADVFGPQRIAAAKAAIADGGQPEDSALIDWPAAARAKYAVFERLFADFVTHDLEQAAPTQLAAAFHAFVRAGGDHLREHALFEALHHKWFGANNIWSWSAWPPAWRDPASATVADYAAAEERAVQYRCFLQWIADASFAAAQASARHDGMRIGMIADLAIGMDRGGSHAWARQSDLLLGLSIGAPPDPLGPRGQDWGLTGFSPPALVASGFEPFLATLRAALRHAGGVRVDHAMGLARLWLIPHGASPADGAYLSYPIDDLLRLIALESQRHRAIVIGEDLGTVPGGFRGRMSQIGIAGMDVLWFTRDRRRFLPPAAWRPDAVAMTSTHDLPTVAGWWKGADIDAREALGLAPDVAAERKRRDSERAVLWRSFKRAGIEKGKLPTPDEPDAAVDAAVRFVAKSASSLALIPIEDVLGLTEQPNLPGTIDEYPNWRQRLDAPASTVLDTPAARPRLDALRERGR
ncbi:MAG: 4-alpha-glucanotransferase [Hyphomicrobiales bacterium]